VKRAVAGVVVGVAALVHRRRLAMREPLADQASYITGANSVVDGGRTSCFSIGTLGQV
jgi:hypothetical protein